MPFAPQNTHPNCKNSTCPVQKKTTPQEVYFNWCPHHHWSMCLYYAVRAHITQIHTSCLYFKCSCALIINSSHTTPVLSEVHVRTHLLIFFLTVPALPKEVLRWLGEALSLSTPSAAGGWSNAAWWYTGFTYMYSVY